MPHQSDASSGATNHSYRVGSSLQMVADDVGATTEARAGTDSPTSSGTPLDVHLDHRTADHIAAARAMASCGVHHDGAVWVTECAWCKRVRSVAGDWQTLTPAVRAAMKIERTHGVCPRCAQGLVARGEIADRDAR
jgi:hypothetical protein